MTDEANIDKAKKALADALKEISKELAYKEVTTNLEKVIKEFENAAPTVADIDMDRLTCTRCGYTYPTEKGDTPIMGEIKNHFLIAVEDSKAKEAVVQCQRCHRLFIAPMGIYIRLVE